MTETTANIVLTTEDAAATVAVTVKRGEAEPEQVTTDISGGVITGATSVEPGDNVVAITVTAEDTTVQKVYTVTINVHPNTAPVLSEVTTPTPDKRVKESTHSINLPPPNPSLPAIDDSAGGSFGYEDADDGDNGFGDGGTIEGIVAIYNTMMNSCGATSGSWSPGTGSGAEIVGTYGTLTLNADGTWSYMLDDTDDDTNALAAGDTGTDCFRFRIDDGMDSNANRYSNEITIGISVEGTNDRPLAGSGHAHCQ